MQDDLLNRPLPFEDLLDLRETPELVRQVRQEQRPFLPLLHSVQRVRTLVERLHELVVLPSLLRLRVLQPLDELAHELVHVPHIAAARLLLLALPYYVHFLLNLLFFCFFSFLLFLFRISFNPPLFSSISSDPLLEDSLLMIRIF